MGAVLGQPGAPGGHPPGPGCPVLGEQCPAQLVQPPGRLVDPDAAGGGLRRDMVIGGEPQLDAEPLGRVQPAQRGQPPVGPARPQLRSSRSVNSNKTAAMTGMSPNASGAAGRCGAWVELKLAEAATRPHTARRGASPDSARAARRVSSTAQTPAAPSRARNSRYGQAPGRPMLSRANPVRPWAVIPVATRGEPAEQHVLGGRSSRLPATRAAGHRLPAEAVRAPRRPRARPGGLARLAPPRLRVSRDGLSAERYRAGAAVPGRLAHPGCLRRTVITYFITRSGNLDHQSESILDKVFRCLIVNWHTGHQSEALCLVVASAAE